MNHNKKGEQKKFIKKTIFVFTALVVLYQLFIYVGSNWGHIFLGQFFMYLYYPISGIIIVAYAIEIIGQFFEGDFVKALNDHMEVPVMVATFALTIFNPQITFPDSYKTVGYWVMGTVLVWAAHHIARTYSKIGDVFTFATLLTILGYLMKTIIESFMGAKPDLTFSPSNIVFYCFLIPASLSLLSLLRYSSKDYLCYIGNKLRNLTVLFGIGVATLFIQVYLLDIRPSVPESISPYLAVIEWVAVCGISFTIFKSARDHVSNESQNLKLGEWTVLTQKITNKKEELEALSDFVEDGKKERLLMLISHILLSNNITYESGKEVIRELVQYRDPEPPKLMSTWAAEAVRKENKRNRQKILEKTLKTVEEILDKNYLLSNVGEYTESEELSDRSRVSKRCSGCGKDYPARFSDCPFCYTRQTSEKLVEKKATV